MLVSNIEEKDNKKEDSCIIVAVYCQTRCFFNMRLTYKTNTLNHYLSMNYDNIYYIDKDLTATINCFINPNSKAIQLYTKAFLGSAHLIVYPDKAKNSTSIIVESKVLDLNDEKEKEKSATLYLPLEFKKDSSLSRSLTTSVITHDTEAILFFKISENRQFQKMEIQNSISSYNIPDSLEFKGFLPIESTFKNVLINIQTKSLKIREFTFYAKFIKINKVKEDKVEDFDDVPNFNNEDIIGEYDRINKKVLININKII